MYYPMMVDLEGMKITIIGGGKVAYRKAAHFLSFNGSVTVISQSFTAEFENLKTTMYLINDTYKEEYLQGSSIVVAATDDKNLNEQIGAYCKHHALLCNVVSNQELSSFIVPSFIKRGELIISVSTGGNSPTLASKIKKELEDQYDSSYEAYVELLGKIRHYILKQGLEETEKADLLKNLVDMDREELKEYARKLK